jgi:hypothetical protein
VSAAVQPRVERDALADRLAERFAVPVEVAAAVVAEEIVAHRDARIQAFVPLLVERAAADRLRSYRQPAARP